MPKLIDEQFKNSYRNEWGEYIEIFYNPNEKDFKEVIKNSKYKDEVRFIACPSKKEVYIFKVECLHKDCAKKLNVFYNLALCGNAKKEGGYWKFVNSCSMIDMINANKINQILDILNAEWGWVNKYIKVDEKIIDYLSQIINNHDNILKGV